MVAQSLVVSSAYRQLQAVERSYVDQYVAEIERRAERTGRTLQVFCKVVPADLYDQSRGLLDRPIVLAALSERFATIVDQSELSPGRILKELRNIAYSSSADWTRLVTSPDGTTCERVFDMGQCTPDQLAAIKTIKIKELPRGGRDLEVQGHDKLKAISLLMTYMGMLEADNKYWHEQELAKIRASKEVVEIEAGSTEQVVADKYRDRLEQYD